jgi:hypothetical protein
LADEWRPRPAQPYRPGNSEARKHGAYREEEIRPLAEAIVGEEAGAAPWLVIDAFSGHARQLARAEAVCELLWRYLAEQGLLDEEGKPRAALVALERWLGRAGRLRGDAGLTPAAWARQLAQLSASGDGGTGQLAEQRRVGAEILASIETATKELGP